MRILTYNGKLVEEVSYCEGVKVVFMKYIKEIDKPICQCGRPINQVIDIVENCPNWKEQVKVIGEL